MDRAHPLWSGYARMPTTTTTSVRTRLLSSSQQAMNCRMSIRWLEETRRQSTQSTSSQACRWAYTALTTRRRSSHSRGLTTSDSSICRTWWRTLPFRLRKVSQSRSLVIPMDVISSSLLRRQRRISLNPTFSSRKSKKGSSE